MPIHHVISEHRYEGIIDHTNDDFTGCGPNVSLFDDACLRAWMAVERIATVEEAIAMLNLTIAGTPYRSVIVSDKGEAVGNFRADIMIRPGETLFAGRLLEQARLAKGLVVNATETQVLAALGVVDKRVVQAMQS